MDWKTRAPSGPPNSGSLRRSGWGMMPTTLRATLQIPAMSFVEPLGLSPTYRHTTRASPSSSAAVRAREHQLLARRSEAGEGGVRHLHPHAHGPRQELEAGVAHQASRQQPGLAQDLEAVADAQHRTAGAGVRLDGAHHR